MNQSNLVVTYTFIFRVLASQAHTCRLMAVTYYCWKSGPKLIENLYLSLKNFNQNDSLNYWSEPAWKQKSSKKHSGDPHYNNHINKLSDSCFFFKNSFSKIVTMRELCDVRKVHKMFHGPYHVLKVICLSPLFSCLSLSCLPCCPVANKRDNVTTPELLEQGIWLIDLLLACRTSGMHRVWIVRQTNTLVDCSSSYLPGTLAIINLNIYGKKAQMNLFKSRLSSAL